MKVNSTHSRSFLVNSTVKGDVKGTAATGTERVQAVSLLSGYDEAVCHLPAKLISVVWCEK